MIAASSNGRVVVAASTGGTAKAWDVANGVPAVVWERKLDSPVSADVALDGTRLVVQLAPASAAGGPGEGSVIAILNPGTGQSRVARKLPGLTCAPVLSPDGRVVAAGRGDSVLLLNADTLATVTVHRDHSGPVSAVAFSPDGRLIASGGRDRNVTIRDRARGVRVRTWRADAADIAAVGFSPNGRMLLTGTADHPPRVWDVETGRLLLEPGRVPASATRGSDWRPAYFTRDGSRIVAGSGSAVVLIEGAPLGDSKVKEGPATRRPNAEVVDGRDRPTKRPLDIGPPGG